MDLISSIIGKNVTDVVIKNNEHYKTGTEQKQDRLDIHCTINVNEIVNLEMQASRLEKVDSAHKNLINKALYYACDQFSGQSIKGKAYHTLQKPIKLRFVITLYLRADLRLAMNLYYEINLVMH